jgi:hypothetical protein
LVALVVVGVLVEVVVVVVVVRMNRLCNYSLVGSILHYNSLMTIHNKYLHNIFQYYLYNRQYLDMFHRKSLLYQDSIQVDHLDILRGSQFHMGLEVGA